MKSTTPQPEERMRRMREMFSEDLAIFAEDYEHFAGISPQGAPARRNKGSRKSEGLSAPPSPERK